MKNAIAATGSYQVPMHLSLDISARVSIMTIESVPKNPTPAKNAAEVLRVMTAIFTISQREQEEYGSCQRMTILTAG